MTKHAGCSVLTTSLVDDLDTDTSGLKGVPLLLSHLGVERVKERAKKMRSEGNKKCMRHTVMKKIVDQSVEFK
jgi:hypothetical protein